jgi:hypothetical protein
LKGIWNWCGANSKFGEVQSARKASEGGGTCRRLCVGRLGVVGRHPRLQTLLGSRRNLLFVCAGAFSNRTRPVATSCCDVQPRGLVRYFRPCVWVSLGVFLGFKLVTDRRETFILYTYARLTTGRETSRRGFVMSSDEAFSEMADHACANLESPGSTQKLADRRLTSTFYAGCRVIPAAPRL